MWYPILAAAVLLSILACAAIGRLRSWSRTLPRFGRAPGFFGQNVQAAKADFQIGGRGIMNEAYSKMKNSNYVVQTQNMEAIVVAPRLLPELRMIPISELSHAHAMVEKILGDFCGIEVMTKSRLHADVCRLNLTRNLDTFLPGMQQACSHTVAGFLKQFPPGVPVPAFGFVFTQIMAITSYVMVGQTLSQDPAWQGIVSSYLQEVIHTAKSLRPYPKAIRPFVRPFIAPKQRVEKILRDADALLTEPIRARQAMDNKDLDVLKFLVQGSPTVDPRTIILQMLVLMSASLYVSTMAATEALYDLVSKPEFVAPLRAELEEALGAEGGAWTHKAVRNLPLLDSFLKESFRFNQPEALGLLRVALRDVTLSDGTRIPRGSFLGMPAAAMSRDEQYYSDPNSFSGRRFYRQGKEMEFASIEPGNIGWGNGRSSCPGRWFASAMNKVILAGLIRDYDITFPGGQVQRPVSVEDNGGLIPSQTQGLIFTKRTA